MYSQKVSCPLSSFKTQFGHLHVVSYVVIYHYGLELEFGVLPRIEKPGTGLPASSIPAAANPRPRRCIPSGLGEMEGLIGLGLGSAILGGGTGGSVEGFRPVPESLILANRLGIGRSAWLAIFCCWSGGLSKDADACGS